METHPEPTLTPEPAGDAAVERIPRVQKADDTRGTHRASAGESTALGTSVLGGLAADWTLWKKVQ